MLKKKYWSCLHIENLHLIGRKWENTILVQYDPSRFSILAAR